MTITVTNKIFENLLRNEFVYYDEHQVDLFLFPPDQLSFCSLSHGFGPQNLDFGIRVGAGP